MTYPWAIFIFGLMSGLSVALVLFRFCLSDIERRIKRMIDEELQDAIERAYPRNIRQ